MGNKFEKFPEVLLNLPKIKEIKISNYLLQTLNKEKIKEIDRKKINVIS